MGNSEVSELTEMTHNSHPTNPFSPTKWRSFTRARHGAELGSQASRRTTPRINKSWRTRMSPVGCPSFAGLVLRGVDNMFGLLRRDWAISDGPASKQGIALSHGPAVKP